MRLDGRTLKPRVNLAGILIATTLSACANSPQSSLQSTSSAAASSTPPIATATPVATPATSVPPDARLVGKVTLDDPAGPLWLASSSGAVWVGETRTVVRIDAATHKVTGTVRTHDVDFSLAATGFGAVWESNFGLNVVYRIDMATMNVVATIPVGDAPEGIAVTASAVWVANHHAGTVSRIDPVTNRVSATIQVGASGHNGPLIITATADDVWVFVPKAYGVVGIDAATNTVIATVPLNGPPASDGTNVWVAVDSGIGQSSAVKIDPTSGKVLATVPIDLNAPSQLGAAVGLGSMWMTTESGLYRIDIATNKVVGHLPCDPACTNGTVVAGGSVWLSVEGKPYLLRVAPM